MSIVFVLPSIATVYSTALTRSSLTATTRLRLNPNFGKWACRMHFLEEREREREREREH